MSSVDQIKSKLGVVDVIESYLKLQKAGANLKACCPFHHEKTPSFFVSPSRESWYCFGCNKGGDIFNFVQDMEGIEFYEALKILADKAGVQLEPVSGKIISEKTILNSLMDEAVRFYQVELKKNQKVIDYLKSRGVEGETAKEFKIGFAPDGWQNLITQLKKGNYTEAQMETAGLVIKSNKTQAGYYDRFRERIMFPLSSSAGQVIGFSGRIFGEDDGTKGGKYINTPQTILYDKSRVLYGFDKAKTDIRKEDLCILVEGNIDVIMSHQAGFKNTVGVCGTALTEEHLKMIKRLTDNLVMAFDKDDAGLRASQRGVGMALAYGLDVKVADILIGTKDPADVVKNSPEDWKKAINNAKPFVQFYLDALSEKYNDSMRLERAIKVELYPYILKIPSETEKDHWIRKISQRTGATTESIRSDLNKMSRDTGQIFTEKDSEEKPKEVYKKSRLQILKERLIGFLVWQKNSEDKDLSDEIIKVTEKFDFDLSPENEENQRFVFEVEIVYSGAKSPKEDLSNLVLEFEKELIKSNLERIAMEIRRLESSAGNDENLRKHLDKFQELTKQFNSLK